MLAGAFRARGMAGFADLIDAEESRSIHAYVVAQAHTEPSVLDHVVDWARKNLCVILERCRLTLVSVVGKRLSHMGLVSTPAWGTAAEFSEKLKQRGLLMLATGAATIRAVTHLDVTDVEVDGAIEIIKEVVRDGR